MTDNRVTNSLLPDNLIIDAQGLTKEYHSGSVRLLALQGINFRVMSGEMVAIMGSSGCGKTTLLNCLASIDEVDSGTILIGGQPLHQMRDRRRTAFRARHMGFIFQSFNLLPVLTARENVEMPLLITGIVPQIARRRAQEMLHAVGLARWQHHKPAELSGGQQQRVAVARALVGRPAIVWADEPTGNLDSASAAAIMDLLCEVNQTHSQTFVLVTHDITVGQRAGRIVEMQDGRIISQNAVLRSAVTPLDREGPLPLGHAAAHEVARDTATAERGSSARIVPGTRAVS